METALAFETASSRENPYLYRSMLVLYWIISICLAIERAVEDWSPVSMMTFTPAALHFLIASLTAGLGGSSKATNPMKVSSLNEKLGRL